MRLSTSFPSFFRLLCHYCRPVELLLVPISRKSMLSQTKKGFSNKPKPETEVDPRYHKEGWVLQRLVLQGWLHHPCSPSARQGDSPGGAPDEDLSPEEGTHYFPPCSEACTPPLPSPLYPFPSYIFLPATPFVRCCPGGEGSSCPPPLYYAGAVLTRDCSSSGSGHRPCCPSPCLPRFGRKQACLLPPLP